MTGRLVLVATPIGNLGDLSPRAVEALAGADVIACEDTRVTRRLLSAAGIPAPRLTALHEANEASASGSLLDAIEAGQTVVLVSDAGMPAVSDPGQKLVTAAAVRGIEVVSVPGPSAALAALVLSGLATDRFVFEGFLPRKGRERKERLAALAGDSRTSVIFESPRRLESTLSDLIDVCGGDRKIAVARELTKLHEEVWRGSLADASVRAASHEPRGEHVLVLEGAPAQPAATDETIAAELALRVDAGIDMKTAVAEVAAALKTPKRRVYELALRSR